MTVKATVFVKTPQPLTDAEEKSLAKKLRKGVRNLTGAAPSVVFIHGEIEHGVKVVFFDSEQNIDFRELNL
jgi:hypothetical protein